MQCSILGGVADTISGSGMDRSEVKIIERRIQFPHFETPCVVGNSYLVRSNPGYLVELLLEVIRQHHEHHMKEICTLKLGYNVTE